MPDFLEKFKPNAELISEILPRLHRQRTLVIIISDGGAARRGFNQNRLKLTKDFIDLWRDQVRHLLFLSYIV